MCASVAFTLRSEIDVKILYCVSRTFIWMSVCADVRGWDTYP